MSVPSLPIHPQGPVFSRLSLGFWRLADAGLEVTARLRLIHTALDHGITTLDHADIYGGYACEALFGEALRREPGLRDRMQLVSKCGIQLVHPSRPAHRIKRYETSAAHIRASVDRSLHNLGAGHLDLLLIHRPDPRMEADDTAAGLAEVIQAGKVRHVGVSNFTPSQFDLLQSRLPVPLVTNQIEVSPLRIAPFLDGTLDHLQRLHIAPMAWSPLAGGRLLTGEDADSVRVREALRMVGEKIGSTGIEQTALAWLLSHPARLLPVIGTTRPERVAAAAGAAGLTFDKDDWFEIWIAAFGRAVP